MRLIYSVGHPDGKTAGSWSATSITSALWFVFPGGRSWHSALTGRGAGIKESILPLSLLPTLPLFLSLYLSRPSSPLPFLSTLSFRFICKQRRGSNVSGCGCTRCRLTPNRLTWVEVYARSYLYASVSTFQSEGYSLRPHTPSSQWNPIMNMDICLSVYKRTFDFIIKSSDIIWLRNFKLWFLCFCFACKDRRKC